MVGGSPIFMTPAYVQPQRFSPPVTTPFVPQASWSPAPPPVPPGPVARGQIPEEPAPVRLPPRPRLAVPTPEALGVFPAASTQASGDSEAVHERLQRLHAICYQKEELPDGGWRVVCLLPTGQPNHNRRFEARAVTQGEAVRRLLDDVDAWARIEK
jgi:hypothetical protein